MKKIIIAIKSFILTNIYGLKLSKINDINQKKILRQKFANSILDLLNIKISVSGIENIEENKQYLFIVNHRSILDPLIIEKSIETLNLPLGFWLAKEDLYKSPFFKLFTKNAGTIFVPNDKDNSIQMMKDVHEKVLQGCSINIFPEGTRNKINENLLPFQKGASLIALKNKLDIIPIYIKTPAEKILKKSLISNEINKIEIIIGKIIDKKERELEIRYKEEFQLD